MTTPDIHQPASKPQDPPAGEQPTILAGQFPPGPATDQKPATQVNQTVQTVLAPRGGDAHLPVTIATAVNVEPRPPRPADIPGIQPNQRLGDFQIGALLGKGGMGSVYHGTQISLDRPVAIKVLPPHLSENEGFRARFGIEAKAVAQIHSQHVIQVYTTGQHEGHHYFVMEYIEGEDLSVKLRKNWRPTHQESLDLIRQAARGLAAAGELGIIHRDIKPANMMLTKKGILKLMDFGLAKLATSSETGLTMAGTIMGTISYFSPEQGRGDVCDQRTDIYALGVVFYELLTGKLPFVGQNATSVIYQHIHQAPRAPKEIDPSIPEDFQAVVLKCMQKQAEDRYQNAAEMLKDLDALAEGRAPHTAFFNGSIRSGGDVVRSKPFTNEKSKLIPVMLTAVIALLVLIIIGGWMAMRDRSAAQSAQPAQTQSPKEPPTSPPATATAPVPDAPPTAPPASAIAPAVTEPSTATPAVATAAAPKEPPASAPTSATAPVAQEPPTTAPASATAPLPQNPPTPAPAPAAAPTPEPKPIFVPIPVPMRGARFPF